MEFNTIPSTAPNHTIPKIHQPAVCMQVHPATSLPTLPKASYTDASTKLTAR